MGAQEEHASLLDLAGRLFKDSIEDAEAFVQDGMKRLGYHPRIEWDDPEPQGNNDGEGGGDFFDRQRQRRQPTTRRVGGSPPNPQRRAGGGEYGS